MSAPPKPDLALLELLRACDNYGLDFPSNTGHILVGEAVVFDVAHAFGGGEQPLPLDLVRQAIGGQSVKRAYLATIRPMGGIGDFVERDGYMRRKARIRTQRRSA